jgi:hypothetical protein
MAVLNENLLLRNQYISIPGNDNTTAGTISNLATTAGFMRLTACTQLNSINAPSGNTAGANRVTIYNANTVLVKVKNDLGTETAANRIYTGTAGDVIIAPAGTLDLIYNPTNAKWCVTRLPAYNGTYTPTLTAVANITTTSVNGALYTVVGNAVQVFFSFVFNDTSANTYTAFKCSLPVPRAANFTSDNQMFGSGAVYNNNSQPGNGAEINATSGEQTAYFSIQVGNYTGGQVVTGSFMYFLD